MGKVNGTVLLLAFALVVAVLLGRAGREDQDRPGARRDEARRPDAHEPGSQAQGVLTASIIARVMDEGTGRPVPGVRVTVATQQSSKDFVTNREGRLVLDSPPPAFTIEAALEGYSAPPPRFVRADRVTEIVLTLAREAAVEGTVLLPDGRPAAGAEVLLCDFEAGDDFLPAERILHQPRKATSDEHGRFTYARVAPGGKRIIAALDGFGPGLGDPFELAPGGARMGITVRLTRPGAVTVVVVPADGSVVEIGYTVPGVADARVVRKAEKVAEGIYRCADLPAGFPLQVRVAAAGWRTHLEGPFTLQEDETRTLRVELERGERIAGIVRDLAGRPVVDAEVIAVQGEMEACIAGTDERGGFELGGLSSRRALVTVRKAGHVTRRYADVPVGIGGRVFPLPAAAAVSGFAPRGVYVCCSDGGERLRTPVGPDGTFRLEQVPPGRITIELETADARRVGGQEIFLEEGERRSGVRLLWRGTP